MHWQFRIGFAVILFCVLPTLVVGQSPPPLLPPGNDQPAPPTRSAPPLTPPVVESVFPESSPPLETLPTPTPSAKPPVNNGAKQPSKTESEIGGIITAIVTSHIPANFKDESQWNKKAMRWDGLIVERKGLKITTRRRQKEVNHGSWKKYEGKLIDPAQNLTLTVTNVRDMGPGKAGFDVEFISKVQVLARYAKWVKGVQLIALSADTRSKVSLKLSCEVAGSLDLTKFPPDMVVAPVVTSAVLDLKEFEVERVSKLNGPVIKEIGSGAKGILQNKIREYQPKIVEKINREIEKNRDKFRISLSDFLSSKYGAYANLLDTELPE